MAKFDVGKGELNQEDTESPMDEYIDYDEEDDW
jgi:hypothetical protein